MSRILHVTYAVFSTLHEDRDRTNDPEQYRDLDNPKLTTLFVPDEYVAAMKLFMGQLDKLNIQQRPFFKTIEFSAGIVLKDATIRAVE